jgi:hypothetical protein
MIVLLQLGNLAPWKLGSGTLGGTRVFSLGNTVEGRGNSPLLCLTPKKRVWISGRCFPRHAPPQPVVLISHYMCWALE